MNRYSNLISSLSAIHDMYLELSFQGIESRFNIKLPDSAKIYSAFWSKGNYVGKLLNEIHWRASLNPVAGSVKFRRLSDYAAEVTQDNPTESLGPSADIILIGCVKQKREGRHRAEYLFISTLFQGRSNYARSTGKTWYVLSAKHGLLAPDDVIDCYDVSLKGQSIHQRAVWSHSVLQQIDQRIGSVQGKTIELHAGRAYRDPALLEGLEKRGAKVTVPLAHLRQGEQLAWYNQPWTLETNQSVVPKQVKTRKQVPDTSAAMPLSELSEITRQITEDFMEGSLVLTGKDDAPEYGWEGMPEILFARKLRAQGVTDANVRIIITLNMTMNRARDANRLSVAVENLYKKYPWAFDPRKVTSAGMNELHEVLVETGVSQRHFKDVDAWNRVCKAMIDTKSPEPFRKVIFNGTGDYDELMSAINANREDDKAWFPLLSGPKISLVWIRCMAEPGGAVITGLEKMPVAVDVQVRKITEYLGVTATYGQDLNKIRKPIQEAWHRTIKEARGPAHLQGTGAALDPVLWFMGKWGCTFCERAGKKLPISRVCLGCRFDEVRAGTSGDASEDIKDDGGDLIREIAVLLGQKSSAEVKRLLSEFGLEDKLTSDELLTAASSWLRKQQ